MMDSILERIRRSIWTARDQADKEPLQRSVAAPAMSGKYHALHKYLVNRYADTVVLTFVDIEALLGFALPSLARDHQEWWTDPATAADPSRQADAWTLAHRTARPNLSAGTVVFERTL